ncbi:LuxR C-terminal-related transcriptional regulator [Knoellia subterranea]|uniref:LuxR family transcriptional regulator n=1 Tax=Knoellia subterranea KCTC 19937 TaxID=1385521 RepID=A0A0A0JK36_9MICO|nr:response regulator transcription factor [Knoellia subterranea]KGN37109.1 LuxR family transcriptional regulator [Knoellia subterranea KCTC 19937]
MRVVIAEDQVLLRDGVTRLLTDNGHDVVAQVGDANVLVDEVNRHRPDLLIADIRMPPTFTDDGARAVLFLRRRFPRLAVVMLTERVDPGLAAQLTDGRVASFGYLLKDRVLDTNDFLASLDAVAGGATIIDPIVVSGYVRREGGRLATLTSREVEVLCLVASGRSNQGIAADLIVSSRTVDAHMRSIFTKLGIGGDPEGNQRVLAVLDWLAELPGQPPMVHSRA